MPWEYVQGGDQVLIHWRPEAYKEKWIIAVAGTESRPFVVSGVPNNSGQLPVIDGREATTRAQLDLVDAEDSDVLVDHPSHRQTFVYGNILLEPDGAGNSQILHYGGDSGDQSSYRKGILYFYSNTVFSRSNNTTLLHASTNDERCDCRNIIINVTSDGSRLAPPPAPWISRATG